MKVSDVRVKPDIAYFCGNTREAYKKSTCPHTGQVDYSLFCLSSGGVLQKYFPEVIYQRNGQ